MTFDEWFQTYLKDNYLVECKWSNDQPPSIARQCAKAAYEAGQRAVRDNELKQAVACEREACIEMCDKIINCHWSNTDDIQTAEHIADQIRKRGE